MSWADRISAVEVLRRINPERGLLAYIEKPRTAYFGHMVHGEKYELLYLIMKGCATFEIG